MITLNGTVLEFHKFPNGETKVDGEQLIRAYRRYDRSIIGFGYENDSDLISLMFVKKFLDRYANQPTFLNIDYMPYSRMDREDSGTTVFTLKYIAEFINSMNFDGVTVVEPHSDVTLALLNRSRSFYVTECVLPEVLQMINFNPNDEDTYLFFPDAGAQKRYSKLKGFRELVGFKKRDFESGRITSLEVVGTAETGFRALIIDDLCSYGGTFMRSAEKLREMGASEIYLLVGHCENSIHHGSILTTNLIDKVFTTDSILKVGHEKIHIFQLGGM